MYWPDTQTGVDVEPARKPVASPVRKFFTEGGLGQPPTVPGGDWFNQITNEVLNVLAAAGIDPSKTDDDQLLKAIQNVANSMSAWAALSRTYAESDLTLRPYVESFETGGTLNSAADVLLHKASGKAYAGVGPFPQNVVAETNPESVGFVDKSITRFTSVQSLLSSGVTLRVGDVVWSGLTKWIATTDSSGVSLGDIYLVPVDGFVALHDCGVVFDRITDNKINLDYAASLNQPVSLSAGYVATSGTHIFTRAVVGVGSKHCGFVNIDTSTSKTYLVTIQNTSEACYGFSVDGSCSAVANTINQDPAAWDAANYDTWFGTRGIFFNACPGISITDIRSFNAARFSCIRLEASDDASLSFCHSKRARGNFGDGFYHFGCSGVKYSFCSSWDTTRIGFVSEGNATTAKISDDLDYTSCTAGYAHDGSINYGGTEYAVGFWAENTDNVRHSMCFSFAVEHAGFVWAPTQAANPAVLSREASYKQCRVRDSDFGFMATPLAQVAISEAVYCGCRTSGIRSQAYLCRPGSGVKVIGTYKQCHAGMAGDGANCIAFSPETGNTATSVTMIIDDCTTSWDDVSRLTDPNANSADISQFSAIGKADVTVRSLRNETTGLVYAKTRQTTAAGYNMALSDVIGSALIQSSGKITLQRSDMIGDIKASVFSLDKLVVPPAQSLRLTNGEVYGSARLIDSILWIMHELGQTPETQRVLGELTLDVERNVATSDYALRIQCEQTVKPTFVVNGTFYNSGAPTAADKNFIWVVRAGTKVLTKAAIKDATVANMYRINTVPANFAVGQQNALMH